MNSTRESAAFSPNCSMFEVFSLMWIRAYVQDEVNGGR